MHVSRRSMALAAVFALALVLISGCSGPETRRAYYMKRAEAYLAEGRLAKAQVELRNVLQVDPRNVKAWVLIGQVAEKQGNIREAFGEYRAAVDLDPSNRIARASLGRIYAMADEPQTALEQVEPLLRQFPDDPQLLIVRGTAFAELKITSEALKDAQRAVQLDPANSNALALLVSLYQRMGEGAKAVEVLTAAIGRMPAAMDLREILARLYVSQNQPQLAEQQLIEVVRLAPREFTYRARLAEFYQRGRRVADADRVLREAVSACADDDAAKLAYVDFLSTERSPAEGQRKLAEFLADRPHNYDLQLALGALQQTDGDSESALATYRHVVSDSGEAPQALTARNRIAAIVLLRGDSAQALSLVTEVLKRNPRDSDAFIVRGDINLVRNDAPAAVADFRAVLREQPDNVAVMRTLARAYVSNGEPALAEETLRSAAAAAPTDVAVRVELAQILMQTQQFPPAVKMLEEAVQQAPSNLEAREALAQAYLGAHDFASAAKAAEDLKLAAPKHAAGWRFAGLAAAAQNHPDEARQEFEHGLEVEPRAVDLIVALVRLDVARDRFPQALTRASAAVATDPQNAILRNTLGELYLASRDYSQATQQFTAAIQSAPNLWLPYRNLALAQIQSGDLRAATLTYQNASTAIGLLPELAVDLAALYERQGRVDDAISEYEKLHERDPRLDLATNNLAMLLVTYRKDPASLERAEKLTSGFDHSDSATLLDTQGWVRFKRGELREALAELETAAARSPASKLIRYHLGMAQIQAKQFGKARANLETALEGEQAFAGVEEARVALAKLRG